MNSRHEGQTLIEKALKEIPFVECKEYLDLRRGGSDYVLLDVRENEEWEKGHVEEAIHIPRSFLEMRVESEILDKNQPVLLYCQAGDRSVLAAKTLIELGYSDIRYLLGGYDGYCKMKEVEIK